MEVNIKAAQLQKGKAWRKYRCLDLQAHVRTLLSLPLLRIQLISEKKKCLILLLEHQLSPPLYLWAVTDFQSICKNMQGTVAELPGVRVLPQEPRQLRQPLVWEQQAQHSTPGTAQETPAHKHTNNRIPLQPLTHTHQILLGQAQTWPAGWHWEKRALPRLNIKLTH